MQFPTKPKPLYWWWITAEFWYCQYHPHKYHWQYSRYSVKLLMYSYKKTRYMYMYMHDWEEVAHRLYTDHFTIQYMSTLWLISDSTTENSLWISECDKTETPGFTGTVGRIILHDNTISNITKLFEIGLQTRLICI